MLILELTRTGKQIFITYCLDKSVRPEDEAFRRKLYDLVVADEGLKRELKGQKFPAYSSGYRHLNSQLLFGTAEYDSDDFDVDKVAGKVIEAMAEYIDNTLPIYDRIVRRVFEGVASE